MQLRTGINFTANIEKYERKEKIFWYIRNISVLITFILLFLIGSIIYRNFKLNIELRKTLEEKDRLFKLVIQNSAKNRKLSEIAIRTRLMREYLQKNDAQFAKYYDILSNFIEFDTETPVATDEPQATIAANLGKIRLSQMSIDVEKNTDISFQTSNTNVYKNLLDLIENEEFLDLFQSLELSSIFLEETEEVQGIRLDIKGKFKK